MQFRGVARWVVCFVLFAGAQLSAQGQFSGAKIWDGVCEFSRPGGFIDEPFGSARFQAKPLEFCFGKTTKPFCFTTTSGAGEGSRSWPRYALETAAVFIEEPSDLLALTALSLVEGLRALPHLRTITVYPAGCAFLPGDKRPNIFIHLRCETNETQQVVFMVGGDSYLGDMEASEHSCFLTGLSWNADAEVKFSLKENLDQDGPRLRGAGWAAGQKIADVFVKKVKPDLEKGTSILPSFPDCFYPPYTPAPDFEFLRTQDAPRLSSTCGLLTRNTTCWTFSSPDAPDQLLPSLSKTMSDAGWEEDRLLLREAFNRLDLKKEAEGLFLRVETVNSDLDGWLDPSVATQRAGGEYQYCATFNHRLTQDESWEFIKPFVEQSATPSQAIVMAQYLDDSMSREFHPVLTRMAPKMAADDLLYLADLAYCSFRNREEFGRRYFIQSALKLLWSTPRKEKLIEDLEEWAKHRPCVKDLREVHKLPVRLTPAEREQYGIRLLEEVVGKKITLGIGEAFAVFASPAHVHAWNVVSDVTKAPSASLKWVSSNHLEDLWAYRFSSMSSKMSHDEEFRVGEKVYQVEISVNPDRKSYVIEISE